MIYVLATQSVPTFVKEILGERVDEEETVTFEAIYSGNPTPGILYCSTLKFVTMRHTAQILHQT